ncbi:MAG: hypothetical protein ACPGVB_06665 [Chitinophagales bacterium]
MKYLLLSTLFLLILVSCKKEEDNPSISNHEFGQSPLSEQRLMLRLTPYMETNQTSIPKRPEILRIYNLLPASITGIRRSLSIPFNWENHNQSLPYYDFQYLPKIEILGKTFFEVYTHEEDLNGFYTKIYYNKEYGIVSFVDEMGVQWRVD